MKSIYLIILLTLLNIDIKAQYLSYCNFSISKVELNNTYNKDNVLASGEATNLLITLQPNHQTNITVNYELIPERDIDGFTIQNLTGSFNFYENKEVTLKTSIKADRNLEEKTVLNIGLKIQGCETVKTFPLKINMLPKITVKTDTFKLSARGIDKITKGINHTLTVTLENEGVAVAKDLTISFKSSSKDLIKISNYPTTIETIGIGEKKDITCQFNIDNRYNGNGKTGYGEDKFDITIIIMDNTFDSSHSPETFHLEIGKPFERPLYPSELKIEDLKLIYEDSLTYLSVDKDAHIIGKVRNIGRGKAFSLEHALSFADENSTGIQIYESKSINDIAQGETADFKIMIRGKENIETGETKLKLEINDTYNYKAIGYIDVKTKSKDSEYIRIAIGIAITLIFITFLLFQNKKKS